MFDWDEENLNHIARHGINQKECEQVLNNNPTDAIEQEFEGEIRFYQMGLTEAGRCLIVITTWRQEDKLRVVTAFPAPPSMQRNYFVRN